MFGKEQPDVTTEDDVGGYIAELQRHGEQDLQDIIDCDFGEIEVRQTSIAMKNSEGGCDALARISTQTTTGSKNNN